MKNDDGLKYGLGAKCWAVYRGSEWKVKHCIVVGVKLNSRWCYTTESDFGEWQHTPHELFDTEQEALYARDLIANNTGGIHEVALTDVLDAVKTDKPDRVTISWIQKKFRCGYSHAHKVLEEFEKHNKGGADE